MSGTGALRRCSALLGSLVAVVLVVGAVPGWGASVSPWDEPARPVPDMSTWVQDPVWQRAQEAGAGQQQQSVSSPQEVAQSATQFDDLSRSEAHA
jgi:hypothetical protein